VKLVNAEGKQDEDGPNGMFHIRDGIICIPRGTTIPDGTVI
jgi:glucose-1-phosphate adenylyltransferase